MPEIATTIKKDTPEIVSSNDPFVNCYWTVFTSSVYAWSNQPYAFRLAEKEEMVELNSDLRNYRIIPVMDYGRLVEKLETAAQTQKFIPDLIVLDDRLMMNRPGKRPNSDVTSACQDAISILTWKFTDPEGYSAQFCDCVRDEVTALSHSLNEINPKSLLALVLTGRYRGMPDFDVPYENLLKELEKKYPRLRVVDFHPYTHSIEGSLGDMDELLNSS